MKPIFTFPPPRRRLAEQSFHLKDRKTCPNKRSHRTLSTTEDLDLVDGNAAKKARVPKQIKYRPKPLTADQGIRLLNVVLPHRYEAAFYVALLQGFRRGECSALRWSNIDYATGSLSVNASLQRVKDEGAVLLPVKSEASERKIPLLPIAAAALRRRKER
jgi:integrase